MHDTIPLKTDTLKPAIVTAKLRPRMKGDTMEYNTEGIHLQPNAMVEELLGRLPGLQIDANGNITFNGEKIGRILVDGEDIFASNPTMVTRTFDASKIASVQVSDRKSDQALFTGIDDGSRIKTLNLVMKESAKDGYFGKAEAGGNSEGYYSADAVLAIFKKKEQFTALGLASNTGVTGFAGNASGSSGGAIIMNGSSDPLSASAGVGIPDFNAIALHYANTWNGSEDHFMGNYQYSHYYTQPVTSAQTSQVQPFSTYNQNQQSQSANGQDQHWGYGTYDLASSGNGTVRFNFYGSTSNGQNSLGATANSSFNDTLANSSQRSIRDQVEQKKFGANILWRKNIANRPDQTFSATASISRSDNMTSGYLYSIDRFYLPDGMVQSVDTVDQRKQLEDHSTIINGSLNYTQPLWKGSVLAASYRWSISHDLPVQNSFDRGDGKYQELVDSLSSQLKTQTVQEYAALNIQGKIDRLTYTLGNAWSDYRYSQLDLSVDSLLGTHYVSWTPQVYLNYTADPTTNFNFRYKAYTQPPPLEQLQPKMNNLDPLHIWSGNPGLKPGYNQGFRLEFHRVRGWILNFGASLDLLNNATTSNTITDSLGRQISQSVNVNGGRDAGINLSLFKNIFGINLELNAILSYARTINFINGALCRNDAYLDGGGFNLNKYEADKYSFNLISDFSYLSETSSINSAAPIHYWTQNHTVSITLFFFRNFEVNTNAKYTWQQQTNAFTGNTSVLLWNAYISHNFFTDRLVAKLQFNNILNANSGITRTNALNTYTQTSTNILGRYWMLSAAWHFDKKFKHK